MKQKAVIYARYSSDNQREESIEGQVRVCKDYAARHNLTVSKVYADRALSGRTADRPEYQHLLKDAAKQKFNVVLVYKGDRISRDRYDKAFARKEFKKAGVQLISVTETIPEGAEGILLESLLDGLAEYYSANLAENTRRGMKENALKCKYNGSVVPYGYKIVEGYYKLKDSEVHAVKKIYDMYLSQESMASILTWLKSHGYKRNAKKDFSYTTLKSLIKNPIYKGTYKFSDVIIEDGVPAIISKEDWQEAQEMIEKRPKYNKRKSNEDSIYWLTGKAYCGKCYGAICGDAGTGRAGKVYRYYSCMNAKKKKCDMKSYRKDELESLVSDLILEIIQDQSVIEQIADSVMEAEQAWQEENKELQNVTDALAKAKRELENLIESIAQNGFNDIIGQAIKKREKEIETLERTREELDVRPIDISRDEIIYYLNTLSESEPLSEPLSDKKVAKILEAFLNAVIVTEKGLSICLNYRQNKELVAFTKESDQLTASLVRLTELWLPNYKYIRTIISTLFFVVYLPFIQTSEKSKS